MLNKSETNDVGDYHQHHIIIGDILLHSESKITVIPVVIPSLSTTSSLTPDKPIIHRLSPNSSGTTGSKTVLPCDLKNTSSIKITHEQIKTTSSSSSKKIMRIHKVGLALVKEFKSKVITPNYSEQNVSSINTKTDHERTHF